MDAMPDVELASPAPPGPDGPPPRLADQVFDTLLADIVAGRLPPGTPMAELDLCNRLGVSRTPVREALIKLSEAGLVRIVPQSGTTVAPISPEGFRNAQFIREHLECAIVAEAVRFIDATSLRELNDLIERQDDMVRHGGNTAFYDLDEAFHRAIARIARRDEVWLLIRPTKVHFDRVRYLTLREDEAHIPLLIDQHREILSGLADCDETRAVAAMRRHLREIFRRAEGIFARQAQAAATQPVRMRRNRKPPADAAPPSGG